MPPSALEQLTRLNINYPMLFKLTNKKTNRVTHCGVLEFVADEGKVYLPLWVSFGIRSLSILSSFTNLKVKTSLGTLVTSDMQSVYFMHF